MAFRQTELRISWSKEMNSKLKYERLVRESETEYAKWLS